MLARRGVARAATTQPQLLRNVVANTALFFERTWGGYETAVLGTLHITPPELRHAALRTDYAAMREMFFEAEPAFEEVLSELRTLERFVNDVML